ncbi:MAG: SNF2-related protein [Prochloraceae cyanobacterium]|nr:SNF2-related protein [Prochloraceae cyanobacterium]
MSPTGFYSFKFKESLAGEALKKGLVSPLKVYQTRLELLKLKVLADYDELVCLPSLKIDKHWYQIETAKKVIKQLGGRAMLADEVGLGKTIEAGIIIKEYFIRKQIKSLLVITPATLVSQWQEELETKFGLSTITTEQRECSPEQFWNNNSLIVASINTAKHKRHKELVSSRAWDLVVVDEAHHLKNRRTQNWKLINAIKKRFILLLTATPVQNNLIELYNLLTLLKPGLLKTESDFKKKYVGSRDGRQAQNPQELRELMREVMIRNTRSCVDVKLPKRFATTITVIPDSAEQSIYSLLNYYIRKISLVKGIDRLSRNNLLMRAGSSPTALESSLSRIRGKIEEQLAKQERDKDKAQENLEAVDLDPEAKIEAEKDYLLMKELSNSLAQFSETIKSLQRFGKAEKLIELLKENRQKTLIFINNRDTHNYLSSYLTKAQIAHVSFLGQMSLQAKDEAVEKFREEVNVMLASETGGEGRNLQFANTIINYDLPWNPMKIEQRIGRLHRIGQTQDVFIFNFCNRGSIEEYLLKILHDKINMFELVVGEIEMILGYMGENFDFSETIVDLWLKNSESIDLDKAFSNLGTQLLEAKYTYQKVHDYDEKLFGDDLEV